ncbi:unnamed protein product, partial [Gadus morhua 'NCC']
FPPQNSDIPFEVNAIAGEGESIIVSLRIRVSPGPIPPFTGFMVDVRKSEIDPAKGSFVEFGTGSTGLTCNGIQDSAVTQDSNIPKTFVQVKWQAQENGSSSFFLRATFVQNFTTFWSPVNVPIQTPASTTQPPTTTLTSKPSTEQPSSPPTPASEVRLCGRRSGSKGKTRGNQASESLQTSPRRPTNSLDPQKLINALSISSLAPASLNNLTIQTAIEKAIRALINETTGSDLSYKNSDVPFEVNAIAGEGESIIVSLGIRVSPGPIPPFTGFMVDVRKSEIDPAKGSFVEFGPGSTGLTCNGIQDSAVTQNSNVPKTFVQVKWQAQENGSSSFILRATFVQDFITFWNPVNVTIQTPATITKPSTTTLTSKPSTEKTSTKQPSTEQTSTTNPSTSAIQQITTDTTQPSATQQSCIVELPNIYSIFDVSSGGTTLSTLCRPIYYVSLIICSWSILDGFFVIK